MAADKAMKAMVLAAGVGSRLDPLTSQVPKPLVPIANTPVMEHTLKLLAKHGFSQVFANLHYLPQKIVEYFGDGSNFGIQLAFKHETKLTGDAGGVRACREFLQNSGTFIVMMGDLVTDADLSAIIETHKRKRALVSIGIKPVDDVSQFGVVLTNKDGFITGFQEKPKPEEALSNLISTGIYVLEPEVFEHIPATGEYGFGRQLFPTLVREGFPVLGVELNGYWSDVGTINQYRESNFDALQGAVNLELPGKCSMIGNAKVWLGDGAIIEDGCQIEGLLMLGKNTRLCTGSSIRGQVIVGDNCLIERNAKLRNSIVWSNCRVQPNAELDTCIIGNKCLVNTGSKHFEVTEVAQLSSPVSKCAV